MKFFDLELGGLGAADIYWKMSGDKCTSIQYTNGNDDDTCGKNSLPGETGSKPVNSVQKIRKFR